MKPFVSIIIPCYNEESTITELLSALAGQSYPTNRMEIIIADGLSEDSTLERIKEFSDIHTDLIIRVVENPARSIPSGLNKAIEAARGEYIIRLDAHSIPYSEYVEKCINALQDHRGDNVGGMWLIKPGNSSWVAKGIALAASHPLGVGDARYRVGGGPQPTDTVPFGSFRKSLFDKIGFYNEKLLSNEDYELNTRIRLIGGVVWFDPDIKVSYYARKTYHELAKQYWRYGYWKAQMLLRFPITIRWRQFLPPVFVLSIIVLFLIGVFIRIAWGLLLLEISIYGSILTSAGLSLAIKKHDISLFFSIPIAIITMHFAWGTSFIWSILQPNASI